MLARLYHRLTGGPIGVAGARRQASRGDAYEAGRDRAMRLIVWLR